MLMRWFFPLSFFGLSSLHLTKFNFQKLNVVQRKMLRSIVGWVVVNEDDWRDTMKCMNDRLQSAMSLHPISPWSVSLFRRQFRYSWQLANNPQEWPAYSTIWNPCNNWSNKFSFSPFRRRGRPHQRWDDNLHKFAQSEFQHSSWFEFARAHACWITFQERYVDFCLHLVDVKFVCISRVLKGPL